MRGGELGIFALVRRREQRGWRASRCPELQEGTINVLQKGQSVSPGPGHRRQDPGAVPEPSLGLQGSGGAGRRPGQEGKSSHPILLSILFPASRHPLGCIWCVFVCVLCKAPVVKANDDIMFGREALESHSEPRVQQSSLLCLVGGFKSQLNLIF